MCNALAAFLQRFAGHRWLGLLPFVLLAGLFAATDVLTMHRVSQLRAETDGVVEDMLGDVEILARLRHDLEEVKLLSDQHVFEKGAAGMAGLDARIVLAQADYDVASALYERQPFVPEEVAPWRSLKDTVAGMWPGLEVALARSRRNDDGVALRDLAALEADFARADADLGSLVAVNDRAAVGSVARVAALQGSATAAMQVLAVAGMVLAIAVGCGTAQALRRRELRVREAATRLEELNRELDAFAGRVAHDLRGPLTTATLATARLTRPGQAAAAAAPSYDVLQRALGRMDAVIGDLLSISRLQASTTPGRCDPASAAEQLREDLAPRAAGIDVTLIVDVQPACVRCAEGLLREVMWNLADNALKYRRSDVGSRVEIRGRVADGRYELAVQDNGIGMSVDEMAKLFAPFYRAASAGRTPGTGLGLSIVKRVVEASGGTVAVTSAPGRGSTFVTQLPLA